MILPEIWKINKIFCLKIFCRGANSAPKNDKSIKGDINFFNYYCIINSKGLKDKKYEISQNN